ncbi:ubiquitin ligase (cullin) of SCF [Coemansia sp. IMI 203386]|nr:ubiquitin ligase (cullin) of SCF [Coemansia sp. IMI 203386]
MVIKLLQLQPKNILKAYMLHRESLGMYLRFFKKLYLQAVLGHIQMETSRLHGCKLMCGYLKAVDKLISTEELWSDWLLLLQSGEQLAWVLNEWLINRHMHVFHEIINLSPVPTVTNARSSSSTETLVTYTGSFIDMILDMMDVHRQLLTKFFDANTDFATLMTGGFHKVVNSNQLQEQCQSILMKLLVKYFYQAVRASGGSTRQAGALSIDLETMIKNQLGCAIKLYNTLCFALGQTPASGANCVAGTRRQCGINGRQLDSMEMMIKLYKIFTDIDTSHNMSWSFSQAAAANSTVSVSDVNIKVLKMASWPAPILSKSSEWMLPPQLAHICGMFADAYNARHSTRDQQHHGGGGGSTAKRRLRWLWEYSKCSVQFFFPHSTGRVAKTGYTFVVNTFQLAILMLFTESGSLGTNYGARSATTNIVSSIVHAELVIFAKARILVQLNDSYAYQLDDRFNSKRQRIDISAIKKQCRAKEEAKVTANTELDRRWYLMSDIAKFMKANRVMTYCELFEGVVSSRSKLFYFTSADIKAALEKVIDQGVVKRSEEDFNRLKYIL